MLWTLSKRGEGGRVFMHLSSDDSMSQAESDVVSMSNLSIIKSLLPLSKITVIVITLICFEALNNWTWLWCEHSTPLCDTLGIQWSSRAWYGEGVVHSVWCGRRIVVSSKHNPGPLGACSTLVPRPLVSAWHKQDKQWRPVVESFKLVVSRGEDVIHDSSNKK